MKKNVLILLAFGVTILLFLIAAPVWQEREVLRSLSDTEMGDPSPSPSPEEPCGSGMKECLDGRCVAIDMPCPSDGCNPPCNNCNQICVEDGQGGSTCQENGKFQCPRGGPCIAPGGNCICAELCDPCTQYCSGGHPTHGGGRCRDLPREYCPDRLQCDFGYCNKCNPKCPCDQTCVEYPVGTFSCYPKEGSVKRCGDGTCVGASDQCPEECSTTCKPCLQICKNGRCEKSRNHICNNGECKNEWDRCEEDVNDNSDISNAKDRIQRDLVR